jgi:perosamine synthetase
MQRTRRELFNILRGRGIGVHVHYIPLHLQPYYRHRYGHARGAFPIAESYYDSALTVPLFPAMTDVEVERVIDAVLAEVR